MKKEWILADNKKEGGSLVERLLATRGVTAKKEIQEFLNPLEIKVSHPNAFTDMPKAVERIVSAIDNNENILVYGDFDADGVTSTSLLIKLFKHLSSTDENILHFIPEREKHGHGLNTKALIKLMAGTKKPKLIITVDCASSDIEQVDFINSFGIDVIITDHHEAPEILPKAVAMINPKAQNALDENLSAKEIHHLTSLAGVGVAFKLAHALLLHYEKADFIYTLLPFVAVGTIADLVPLVGENRYFVTKGLELISAGKHYGIKRLLEVAGYELEKGITAENIAFGVAPRINASGRLDTVEEALKVLVSDNNQEIEMSIMSLENFNKIRQELCDNTFLEAQDMLKNEDNTKNAIVLFNPKWHIGIIGIVASKLVEKHYKPTFLMTYSEETKQIRCSARGVEGLNIYDIMSASEELFDGFGGHEMAGGLSFSSEKVTFEQVKTAIQKTVEEMLQGKELTPKLKVDLELKSSEVDINLIDEINKLQPFGMANPAPVFTMNDLTLGQKSLMGSNKNHLKIFAEDSTGNIYTCIWWQKGDISLESGDKLDVAFCPQINSYNGETSIQLILQDVHADNLIYEEMADEGGAVGATQNELKIYDHRKKTDIFSSIEDYVKTSKLDIIAFVEDKQITEQLKPYESISRILCNRNNITPANALMFFDYPATPELMAEVLEKVGAKSIHFMNYDVKNIDERELLKMFFGMLRFSHNNLDGKVDINRCAAALALANEAVIVLLSIFEEGKVIEILKKTESEYFVKFDAKAELSKLLHTEAYNELPPILNETQEYKKSMLEVELESIIS